MKNTLFSCISPIHLIYYSAQFLNAFEKIYLVVLKDETSLQLIIQVFTYFCLGRTLRNGWRHLKKGEITLYSQKTESRNRNFKIFIKYRLFSEDKGSDTFL